MHASLAWGKTLFQLFLVPAALDKDHSKVEGAAKWAVAGLLFLPLALFSVRTTGSVMWDVLTGASGFSSEVDSRVAVALILGAAFVMVGLLGDQVPNTFLGKVAVLALLLAPVSFVGYQMLHSLAGEPLKLISLSVIVSIAMGIFYALNTSTSKLRFVPTVVFLSVTSLTFSSSLGVKCAFTQCLIGGLGLTSVAIASSSFTTAVTVMVAGLGLQGMVEGEYYVVPVYLGLVVVAYLLTTVLNSTKDSEDVGGLTMEKLVQTLVSFAVVAGFAIFFLYMTDSGVSQIVPTSQYLGPVVAVSITVLLQLWPNMLLSACPGKTALWFGAAGVALDSYIPLVHSLGQTLPGYLPFVDKALNFVASLLGDEGTLAHEFFANVADRFLAFYLVGLVVQFALLSPVSNSDAENTSKSILSQGISLEGLSDTYPMLATFLSAILLLCAVAVPLQDQEVQASTVLIAPVVISLVGAASAAAFFLLALRVALTLHDNYINNSTTLFSMGVFSLLVISVFHFLSVF